MRRNLLLTTLVMTVVLAVMVVLILIRNSSKLKEMTAESTPSPTIPVVMETAEPAPVPTPEVPSYPKGEDDPAFYDTSSYLLLANKKHKLPDGYEPSDLTTPNVTMRNSTWQFREEAARAMEEMFAAAAAEGVQLVCSSGYRSQDYQEYLWNNYAAQSGEEYADRISSRAGYSDHQTGLAVDLGGTTNPAVDFNTEYENTAEGIWAAANAHKYGFIMRYPKGKEEITGYTYEPWHFRYIGVEYATMVYEADPNMTFEEFFDVAGGDYAE